MGTSSSREPELPERYLDRLGRRLNRQRLWNCMLAVFPPLLLLAYAVVLFFLLDWVSLGLLIFSVAAIAGVGLAAVLHFETTLPSHENVARLLDDRVGGKEHFRTLATIDPSRARPSALARLRFQSSALLRRVNLERDFPYRIRRGSACSLAFSVLSVVLLHFFLVNPVLSVPDGAMLAKVPDLARQFSRESGLEGVASSARRAAGELRQTIQNTPMVKNVMQRIKAQLGSGSKDGQQRGQGQDAKTTNKSEGGKGNRQQENTAGTEQTPGQGREPGAAGQTPGKDREGLANASNGEPGDRRPNQGDSPEGEKESKPGGPGERDDPEQPGRKNDAPKDQAKREKGRAGAANPGEDIPQGEEPDRFHDPGENTGGVEGGRFVTVALPKALSSGGGEDRVAEKLGGGSEIGIPVSNVPLPPRTGSEPAAEKQHMPLEYKGLIK